MNEKYLDEDGNNLLVVSSNVPGVSFIPPGKTPEEAIAISNEEHAEIVSHAQLQARDYVDPQQEQIDSLQRQLDELKQKLAKKA